MSDSVLIANSSPSSSIFISGATPTSDIDLPDGKKYFDIVNLIAPLFFKGIIDWTDPFPKVSSPNKIALLWSCKAPATISAAEADPVLINTINGLPFILSPLFAKNFLFSLFFLLLFCSFFFPSHFSLTLLLLFYFFVDAQDTIHSTTT